MWSDVRSKPFLFNNRGGYKNLTAVFPLPYFDGLVGWTAWVGGMPIISHGVKHIQ